MSEPSIPTVIAFTQAGGLTLFGVATGLDPALIVAGAAGGWWALSYTEEPGSPLTRTNRIALSSLIAAWGSPTVLNLGILPETLPEHSTKLVVAILIGLIAIDFLGKGIFGLAKTRIGEFFKKVGGDSKHD